MLTGVIGIDLSLVVYHDTPTELSRACFDLKKESKNKQIKIKNKI